MIQSAARATRTQPNHDPTHTTPRQATSPQEKFEDLNGDRAWQEGEPYVDRNSNGVYDPGAHIKLTVAKYHLPSGRCPHREFDKEGRIVDPAWGVRPDIEIEVLENKPEDAWKNTAVFAIRKTGKIREFIKAEIEKNQALFRQLAEGDDGDPQRYPGSTRSTRTSTPS